MFGCKCRKADVWQLGTSGKLKAKTGFFPPSTAMRSNEEQWSSFVLCGTTDR